MPPDGGPLPGRGYELWRLEERCSICGEMPRLTVKGFRVVRGGDGLFIGLPQREYKVDGLPRYVNQVVFRDTTLREQFTSELMTAYERWAGGETANPGAEASPAPG